jgi:hypothetical protein
MTLGSSSGEGVRSGLKVTTGRALVPVSVFQENYIVNTLALLVLQTEDYIAARYQWLAR